MSTAPSRDEFSDDDLVRIRAAFQRDIANAKARAEKEPERLARAKAQKRRQYLKQYGMSPAHYDELVRVQSGRCAICRRHQSRLSKPLFVDHSHDTGSVRGLLCHRCNVGLGWFSDNQQRLTVAAEYLQAAERADRVRELLAIMNEDTDE